MGDFLMLGVRIKELRSKVGKNQRDFAKMVGCTAATLSAYENGSKSPSLEIVKGIAEKCHVSIDWLCGLTEKENYQEDLVTYADMLRLIIKLSRSEMIFKKWEVLFVSSNKDNIFAEQHPDFAILRTSDYDVVCFFKDWEQMYNLYNTSTIDKHLYDLWLEDRLQHYENMPLVPPIANDEDMPD